MPDSPERRLAAGLVLCAAMFQPGVAAAKGPVILEPSGKWQVDWNKTICTLARQFGKAEAPSFLIFERFGPTSEFQLRIVSNQFRYFKQGGKLWQRFGNGERVAIANVLPGMNGKMASIFISNTWLLKSQADASGDSPKPATAEQEAAVTSLTLDFPGKVVTFATGPLDKAFAAMRACTSDLVKSWGFDVQQQQTLTKRAAPTTKPRTWLTSSDYPPAMLIAGKQAIVNFRLNVDAAGKPSACEIQRAYSDKAFQDLTCAMLMKRAKFFPALDAQGRPVPSFYIDTVTWIMQA